MLANNTFETRFPNSSKGEHVLPHILGMHPKFHTSQEKEINSFHYLPVMQKQVFVKCLSDVF